MWSSVYRCLESEGRRQTRPPRRPASRGGNVSVQVVWPPAAGAYEQPGMDLRIKNGNAFAIALPLCPR
jgi:hypothetical protein